MKIGLIVLGCLLGLVGVVLLVTYICFRMAFYVPNRKKMKKVQYDLPEGDIYEPYWPAMRSWMDETRAMPHEDVEIRSFDGLTLRGKYYEYAPGAVIELMFHGYRGGAERDLCGGVQRCFALGRSALIVDQRACGGSGGNVITFGVKEHRDCLAWVDFVVKKFGPDVQIILTGISMGASTVLMAAGKPLPDNVIGVLADCGFTSARDIIRDVVAKMGLPPRLVYPFIRLGARLFGGFRLEETPAIDAMQWCTVPVIFFHGEADDYVPCWMSRKNYRACPTRKRLVTIPGAGHGLCYLTDSDTYLEELVDFFGLSDSGARAQPSNREYPEFRRR